MKSVDEIIDKFRSFNRYVGRIQVHYPPARSRKGKEGEEELGSWIGKREANRRNEAQEEANPTFPIQISLA